MPLSLSEKKVVVAEVAEVAKEATSVVAAEYRGLNVAEMTELRRRARTAGVYVRVVPNNLAKRAVESTDFECLREGLKGPLVLAFARDDPGSAARVVRDYRRTNQKLEVRLVAFGGQLVDPADIDTVANLPTWDEAIARLMAVLKAPVTKLARTLAEPHARLVRAMDAVRQQKESAD
ncbi:MAG: 50S ribosomal protein L10 [Immundisolibacterales bacterium]|nr:50S ribosomal protein L10 [Immundisolibacterales bacterium]